ncbi:MAG: hypothetical protein ACNS62_07965 [Candidatus Cyclobacteriaceae bacterium M3_2C_046]
MKKLTFLVFTMICLSGGFKATAQWRLNGGIDLIKTPFFGDNWPSVNIGAEVAYFVTNSVGLTGGIEIWDEPANQLGGSLGVRWYPVNPVFFRMRGILSEESDFSLGLGYAIPLSRDWRLETMADYFAVNQDFAIRVGFGYRF